MTDDDTQSFGQGVDPHAELFARDDAFYRVIRPAHADFYRSLVARPVIRELMDSGALVPTEIAEDGARLVLKHARIWPVTYPFEWTPGMFQQAALLQLRLVHRLMRDGLCTQDAHLWNIVFDGVTPRFVDFTSIIPLPEDKRWPRFAGYAKFCANPMRIMQKGYPTLARQLMRCQLEPIDRTIHTALFQHPRRRIHMSHRRRFKLLASVRRWAVEMGDMAAHVFDVAGARLRGRRGIFRTLPATASLAEIEQEIARLEALDLCPPIAKWSEYYSGKKNSLPVYDGTLASIERLRTSTPKHEAVMDVMRRWKPRTVLDLGCNRGLYSQFAALEGARVIGVDLDEWSLEMMHRDTRALGTKVTPLFLDPCMPAEAQTRKFRPLPQTGERIRSEAVFCLALTHHMVHGRMRMNFEEIAQLLSEYASRHVLVEFVDPDDKHIKSNFDASPEWYNLENFRATLARHFPRIEVRPSYMGPRHLLLCERHVA